MPPPPIGDRIASDLPLTLSVPCDIDLSPWATVTVTRVIPMKKRCLPTCLIIRNICLALLLIASGVVLVADIHASANQEQEKTEALRRLFVYQLIVNADQE